MPLNITDRIARVNSVLTKNDAVRNEMLHRNKGKYSQYDEVLSPAIGEAYEMRDLFNINNPSSGKSLSTYTYDGTSDYSNGILFKYGLTEKNVQYSEDLNPIYKNRFSSNITYTDYHSNVYGDDDAATTFIDSLLAGINPEYAMREYRVGVVDDLRVFNALNGIITTNPNFRTLDKVADVAKSIWNGTFDIVKDLGDPGTDTRLGIITNTLYANALKAGANFNTARGRYNIEGNPYITPYLYEEYGNNSATLAKLSDILWIDPKTGRTRDDLGVDIEILDYSTAISPAYSDELGYQEILINQFSNNGVKYTPEIGRRYLEYYGDRKDWQSSFFNEVADGLDFKTNSREGDKKTEEKTLHYIYDELDKVGSRPSSTIETDENGDPILDTMGNHEMSIEYEFDKFMSLESNPTELGSNNLLAKTKNLFNQHRINTMIGRFHVSNGKPSNDNAYDERFGNSHGRSLKKLNAKTRNDLDVNGYENPYCRTWTYHHQYSRYKDAIRPFNYVDENGEDRNYTIKEIQDNVSVNRAKVSEGITSGGQYLNDYSVLGNNGFVKIAPYENDYLETFGLGGSTSTERDKKAEKHLYMFSIENLAWKDYRHDIEKMRRGPNGGRIMWFPPYDLSLTENVNVNWNENTFIGRGESVFTYSNTTRTAQLGFTILIDHPSLLDTNAFKKFGGKESEGDIDADILRYFAGCDNFVFKPDEVIIEKEHEEQPMPEVSEEPAEGGTIRFAVFFPNNYSGNMHQISKTDIEQRGNSDEDWWKYLLMGKNITSEYTECGYEVCDIGVSDMSDDIKEGQFIYACNRKCNADFVQCDTEHDASVRNKDKRRRFRYRVDFDLKQNALHYGNSLTNDSYIDSKSYQLNLSKDAVTTKTNGNFPDITCSFGAFMSALLQVIGDPEESAVWNHMVANDPSVMDDIDLIVDILENNNINNINVKGGATNQDSPNTLELAKRRARTVGATLKKLVKKITENEIDNSDVVETHKDLFNFGGSENISGSKDINTIQAKYQRCALVEIAYGKAVVDTAGNDNGEESLIDNNSGDGIDGMNGPNASNSDVEGNTPEAITKYGNDTDKIMTGYEYEYFSRLEADDPMVFKVIHDKYKYFDPAFHSLSPEGFNARLNFLHQCTRQGHTVSASDINGTGGKAPTAGNLSFGRMPVCVLRIGDFINSRMIITSMSIQYSANGTTWDLNPEGIGVQPMFAKVEMGVVLLGGSTLNGPISRLQNAQTFDYYANTGVYDPRADRISIGGGDYRVDYQSLYTPYTDTPQDNTDGGQ